MREGTLTNLGQRANALIENKNPVTPCWYCTEGRQSPFKGCQNKVWMVVFLECENITNEVGSRDGVIARDRRFLREGRGRSFATSACNAHIRAGWVNIPAGKSFIWISFWLFAFSFLNIYASFGVEFTEIVVGWVSASTVTSPTWCQISFFAVTSCVRLSAFHALRGKLQNCAEWNQPWQLWHWEGPFLPLYGSTTTRVPIN